MQPSGDEQPPAPPRPLIQRALALLALLALLASGAWSAWAILSDRAEFGAPPPAQEAPRGESPAAR